MVMAYVITFLLVADIGLSTLCINCLNLHITEAKLRYRKVTLPKLSQ